MNKSIILKNAKIVSSDDVFLGNVEIFDGKIKNVFSSFIENGIDLKGKYLLPGVIDPHVHFRDPGFTEKEDFFSGSASAVSGGVTTIFDMPNTNPPTFTIEELWKKREIAKKKSLCNFGFFFGAGSKNIDEIKKLKNENVAGLKIFMNLTTGNLLIKDDEVLKKIAKIKNLLFAFHAEGNTFEKVLDIFVKENAKIYLCHTSLKTEIDEIKKLKNKNYPVFCEISPHHLFLKKKFEKKIGNFAFMKPPLVDEKNRQILLDTLKNDLVDTIGSDHAPHTIDEKKKMIFGVPGVETSLLLMLDAVNKNLLDIKKLVKIMSENPAKIFGIKNKGKIKSGYDADFVVVDLKSKTTIKNKNIFSKCGWSPFDGFELKGKIIKTFVNGNLVFNDGKLVDKNSRGTEVLF